MAAARRQRSLPRRASVPPRAAGARSSPRDRRQSARSRHRDRPDPRYRPRPARDIGGVGRREAVACFLRAHRVRARLPPAAIAYVGDRVDNDVTPAEAGRNVRRLRPARSVGLDPVPDRKPAGRSIHGRGSWRTSGSAHGPMTAKGSLQPRALFQRRRDVNVVRSLGLLVCLLVAACGRATGASPVADPSPAISPAGGPPGVTGTVTAGPVCPVETVPPKPECAPRPVAGAVIVATDAAARRSVGQRPQRTVPTR